eukprot:snap_masked-scaffold_7-processed-gene-9.26-mRNA-1 protein AED:1.00 eAED:1.00 QI:0/0/0/0/1/1/2/0/497
MAENKIEIEEPLLHEDEPIRKQKVVRRIVGLDLFRGLIMIIMSWDHLKDIVFDRTMHGSEAWQGEGPDYNNSLLFFFARAISDLCAPGFFFTMGIGMVYLMESRRKRLVPYSKVLAFFAKRSFLIFLVGRYVNFVFSFPWKFQALLGEVVYDRGLPDQPLTWKDNSTLLIETSFIGEFQVMTALSFSMFFSSFLLWVESEVSKSVITESLLKHRVRMRRYKTLGTIFLASFILCFVVSNILIVHFQYGDPRQLRNEFPGVGSHASTFCQILVRFLFIPGPVLTFIYVAYPVIPWIGLTFLGISFGLFLKADSRKTIGCLKFLSIFLLLSFVLLRLFFGHYGSERGFPVGDGSETDDWAVNWVIEFLWTLKYPPSPAYAMITMGINFAIISFFSQSWVEVLVTNVAVDEDTVKRLQTTMLNFLLVLGNAPLIFYCAHFLIITTFAVSASYILGEELQLTSLSVLFLLWIPLNILLYPICKYFIEFRKQTPPDSYWRLF